MEDVMYTIDLLRLPRDFFFLHTLLWLTDVLQYVDAYVHIYASAPMHLLSAKFASICSRTQVLCVIQNSTCCTFVCVTRCTGLLRH